jgi:hypothetical protein
MVQYGTLGCRKWADRPKSFAEHKLNRVAPSQTKYVRFLWNNHAAVAIVVEYPPGSLRYACSSALVR